MELPRNKMVGIKTKDIVFNPEPLKEEDAQLFQKLKSSILKRGQIRNIVVCESEGGKYECLEGSKITKAMMDLGQEDIMAINLGELSEDEKNLVRLETFKDYFLVNYSQVGMVMKEMKNKMKVEDFCGTIPFDKRQSENLIAMTEFDWELFAQNKQIEGQKSLFEIFEDEITEDDVINLNDIIDSWDVNEQSVQQLAPEEIVEVLIFEEPEEVVKKEETELEKTLNVLVNVIEEQTKIMIPNYVYTDSLQDIQMGSQEEIDTLIANNEPIVILFRGTFSNCRLFINETIKK